MSVGANNYQRMGDWFAHLVPQFFPTYVGTEADPVMALDRIAATISAAKARQGLSMAINDIVEMTAGLSGHEVAALDRELAEKGIPTLSEVRATFSRDIQRALRRGHIRNDVEYYALRNAAELAENEQEQIWRLIAEYESRAANAS